MSPSVQKERMPDIDESSGSPVYVGEIDMHVVVCESVAIYVSRRSLVDSKKLA
jgi:hypothetical protein